MVSLSRIQEWEPPLIANADNAVWSPELWQTGDMLFYILLKGTEYVVGNTYAGSEFQF